MLNERILADYFKSPRFVSFLVNSRVIEGETGTFFETKIVIHYNGESYNSLITLLKCVNIRYKEIPDEGKNVIIHIPKLPISKVAGVVGKKKYVFKYIPRPMEQLDTLIGYMTNKLKASKVEGPTRDALRDSLTELVQHSKGTLQTSYNDLYGTMEFVDTQTVQLTGTGS